MAILVSAFEISKAFSARPLFEKITFSIESRDRIGLVGPNGAGKSTLLKILAGESSVDQGTLSFQKGLRIGYLPQVPIFKPGATVQSAILEGAEDPHDWQAISMADELMSKLSLNHPEVLVETLSGGWRKRVALGRELVKNPDLLLLDEPTNHLDVESILWLEDWLSKVPFAVLTVSHDRLFLQRTVNQIMELDRRNPAGLLSIRGDYATYVETKEQLMAGQEQREIVLKNTLRRETEWLRRGAKARTTKQQARIDRAGELKKEVEDLEYRNSNKKVNLDFQSVDKNPKKLIEAIGISKSFGGKKIFSDVNVLLTPKKRVGLLGPNGCGKSTLIRALLGLETPDTGQVTQSEHLKVAYFEQNRESLDPEITVSKTLCPSGDFVDFRGGRMHIRGYLDRFLFTPGQMEMKVGKLSGGEQSRLLIARLMLQPANLLVLDEPTNDLDFGTLNILEECLQEFAGAVLLVTHDRYFLDQVATQILAFSPSGEVVPFADLSQWETWKVSQKDVLSPQMVADKPAAKTATSTAKKKLSYKEQLEFDSMESNLAKLEAQMATVAKQSSLPENASNSVRLTELSMEMNRLQDEIDRLYERWGELEAKV